jgi:hypothetical protein
MKLLSFSLIQQFLADQRKKKLGSDDDDLGCDPIWSRT